jgi:hypothetical protein
LYRRPFHREQHKHQRQLPGDLDHRHVDLRRKRFCRGHRIINKRCRLKRTHIGSLNGIHKAVAGVVTNALVNLATDVTGILGIANGGTGTSTAPALGQVLVGNASGGFTYVATSTFGNASFSTTSAIYFSDASTTVAKTYSSNIFTAPQTFGNATTTNQEITNALTFSGNRTYSGTGTSSPSNSFMYMPGSALFGTAAAAPNGIISPFNIYVSGDQVDTTTKGNGNLIDFSVTGFACYLSGCFVSGHFRFRENQLQPDQQKDWPPHQIRQGGR